MVYDRGGSYGQNLFSLISISLDWFESSSSKNGCSTESFDLDRWPLKCVGLAIVRVVLAIEFFFNAP